MAVALSAGIIACGALLAISPQVRAAAQDFLIHVAGVDFLIGSSPTSDTTMTSATTMSITPTTTTHEAAQQQGVKLPRVLPAGYNTAGATFVSDQPHQWIVSWGNDKNGRLDLTRIDTANDEFQFALPGASVKEVKLKNRTVASVVFTTTAGVSISLVQWKDGNSVYSLANDSNDLSLDELLAVADSVQ